MNRRTGWGSIGTALEEDDLKTVLGASAGARNAVLEQRMRETTPVFEDEAAGRSARPSRPLPAPVARIAQSVATRSTSAPAPRATASLIDELERLGELRARGLITDDEFVACKRRLLGTR